jgi:hypothetical protein
MPPRGDTITASIPGNVDYFSVKSSPATGVLNTPWRKFAATKRDFLNVFFEGFR